MTFRWWIHRSMKPGAFIPVLRNLMALNWFIYQTRKDSVPVPIPGWKSFCRFCALNSELISGFSSFPSSEEFSFLHTNIWVTIFLEWQFSPEYPEHSWKTGKVDMQTGIGTSGCIEAYKSGFSLWRRLPTSTMILALERFLIGRLKMKSERSDNACGLSNCLRSYNSADWPPVDSTVTITHHYAKRFVIMDMEGGYERSSWPDLMTDLNGRSADVWWLRSGAGLSAPLRKRSIFKPDVSINIVQVKQRSGWRETPNRRKPFSNEYLRKPCITGSSSWGEQQMTEVAIDGEGSPWLDRSWCLK